MHASTQAAHTLSDKRQLYAHLLRTPDGTYSGALKDAYPTVLDDIAALRNEGLIWLLPSVDVGGDDVLYPREERPMISVSPDVAALWHEVTVCSRPPTHGITFLQVDACTALHAYTAW